jgi:hypothetical protein
MVNKDRIMPLPTKECRQARHNECSDPDNCNCYCHKRDHEEHGHGEDKEEDYQ